jgi:hypothetical protein
VWFALGIPIVEAHFADSGYQAAVCARQLRYRRDRLSGRRLAVLGETVRVQTYTRTQELVVRSAHFEHAAVVFAVFPDHHNMLYAGAPGSSQNLAAVRVELAGAKVGVTVNHYAVATSSLDTGYQRCGGSGCVVTAS